MWRLFISLPDFCLPCYNDEQFKRGCIYAIKLG